MSWVSTTTTKSESAWYWRTFNSDAAQKNIAFLLKAMGDYGLFVIVVGLRPKDHLLTYYNGDLEGRVEDIHLKSKDAELKTAIVQGRDALRIKIPEMLIDTMVAEASGSVGLDQRLERGQTSCGSADGGQVRDIRRQLSAHAPVTRGFEYVQFLLQAPTDTSDEKLTRVSTRPPCCRWALRTRTRLRV